MELRINRVRINRARPVLVFQFFREVKTLTYTKTLLKHKKAEKVVSCNTVRQPLTKKAVKIKNCAEGAEHTKTYSVFNMHSRPIQSHKHVQ